MLPPLEVLHLPVRTRSNHPLGVVTDVIVDPDTQGVVSYCVRSHRLIPAAITKTLIIARAQVIGFDTEGMIVDDAVLTNRAPSTAPLPTA